ncbi:hypothetical protein RCO27_04440 [Sphingosinicella sp. LHD-64]|uniref:hypothetical protein n=1 Tax=Sphingosinicella sp. LHD-64 TaxID=3072139 RepID=UPI00280F6318|nr:hypothetical protein [Sphingosinicella sp. LHD-64]MDQ8755470.1 hypothetical protein [Sphingosinicella sp. LHD-64]
MKATIGGILSGTLNFMKANWLIMLGMVVAVFVVLGLLGFLMVGSLFGQAMTGAPPDPAMVFGMMGRFFLFYLIAMVVLYGTSLSVWRHGMTGGQDSVAQNLGWAIGGGAMLALLYIGLVIVLYIVLAIIGLILIAVVGVSFASMGPGGFPSQGLGAGAVLLIVLFYVAFLVGMLWIAARLSLIGPVMAAERTINPITGLMRSWSLTGPSQWTIVGFFVLTAIAATLALLVAGAILATANAQLLVLLLYVPLLLFWWSMPPGIYGEVTTTDRSAVFQ